MARSQRRTALFYDAPLSTPEDVALLKGMLLFFDDIAVFSTPEHRSRAPAIDPYLSAPLAERGLLQFVDPRNVTASHTEAIVRATLHRAAMENEEHWLAAAAAGDWYIEVPRLQGRFPGPVLIKTSEFSSPRVPGSLELFKLLAQEGLLFPDESTHDESVVIPGNASVVNSILAQAVRATAGKQGRLIEPVATRRDEARVFSAIFDDAVESVGASDVVMSDLPAVTLNFCQVGLDDILDFRARHRSEFRAYVLALQALLASASSPPDLADRRAALVDEAHRLRELQLRRWTKLGGAVSLGIVGAAWTLASGDLLGALIGGTTAGSTPLPDRPTPVSAYTTFCGRTPSLRPDGFTFGTASWSQARFDPSAVAPTGTRSVPSAARLRFDRANDAIRGVAPGDQRRWPQHGRHG